MKKTSLIVFTLLGLTLSSNNVSAQGGHDGREFTYREGISTLGKDKSGEVRQSNAQEKSNDGPKDKEVKGPDRTGSNDHNWPEPGRSQDRDRNRPSVQTSGFLGIGRVPRKSNEKQNKEKAAREARHKAFVSEMTSTRDKLKKDLAIGSQYQVIRIDGLEMLKAIRKDLIQDESWHAGDFRLVSGMLLGTARSISKMTADILGASESFISPGGASLASAIGVGSEIIERAIEEERLSLEQVDSYLKGAVLKDRLSKGEPVIAMTLGIIQRMDDISAMGQLPDSQRKLKNEIRGQLSKLEKEIKKYETKIAESQVEMEQKQMILEIVEKFLAKEQQTVSPQ